MYLLSNGVKIISFITDPQVIRHILEHLAAGSERLPPGQSPSGAEPGSERPLATEPPQRPAQPRGLSWKWGESMNPLSLH